MNANFTSPVARAAAAILTQLAGQLVSIHFVKRTNGSSRRLLAIYNPNAADRVRTRFNPAAKNLLMVWDADAGQAKWLPLDRIDRIVAAGQIFTVHQPAEVLTPAQRIKEELHQLFY